MVVTLICVYTFDHKILKGEARVKGLICHDRKILKGEAHVKWVIGHDRKILKDEAL